MMCNSTRTLLALLIVIVFLLVSVGCKTTTQNKKGSISLTIELDGLTDHSGISVYLYPGGSRLLQLQGLTGVNQPGLLEINPNQMFDHRAMSYLKSTLTDQSGNCAITDIEIGTYTLVYLKDGWGYGYVFDVTIDGSESLGHVATLYHEILLDQTITGNYNFESGKTYVAENNVTAIPGSNVTIQPRANILLSQQSEFTIMGGLTVDLDRDSFSRITSRDHIYNPGGNVLKGGGVVVDNQAAFGNIKGLVFSYLYDGMKVHKADVTISECLYLESLFALQILGCSGVSVHNSIFSNNFSNQGAAIYTFTADDITLERNYFINNWYSALLELSTNCVIQDNYFKSEHYDVYTNWESTLLVRNNLFKGSGVGIANAGRCDVEALFNTIEKNVCVATIMNQNQAGNAVMGFTLAHDNNFLYGNLAVDSRAMFGDDGQPVTLDFSNNYWGTSSENEIADSVYDFYDSPASSYPSLNWAIIDFRPYKSSLVANAGIRPR